MLAVHINSKTMLHSQFYNFTFYEEVSNACHMTVSMDVMYSVSRFCDRYWFLCCVLCMYVRVFIRLCCMHDPGKISDHSCGI